MIDLLTLTTPRHDFQICTYKSPYIWMRTAKSGNNMTMECFVYLDKNCQVWQQYDYEMFRIYYLFEMLKLPPSQYRPKDAIVFSYNL